MLRALDAADEISEISGEAGPVPDRCLKRIHCQHLAHPDGPDRESLCGTSILGGRGSYLGAVAGVMLVTRLQSILSVMQIPEFGRQIVYGVVIVCMSPLYGRGPRTGA